MAKKQNKTPRKPYVQRKTIWNKVGGGFSNPGESKIIDVGKHKVLLTRGEKLDKYGNPVHTATLMQKNGQLGKPYRSTGSATDIVAGALRRNGIEVKSPRPVQITSKAKNRASGKNKKRKV